MTFVVTEGCIRCRHTDCVDVCPTDASPEGTNFLAIDRSKIEAKLGELKR